MATKVEKLQDERTNLSDVFSFFEKGGAKKAAQKENFAMKTHLQFEAIRRAGTASMLKEKFEAGEEDDEEEEEEEEDYFTSSTADPNLVKCERVNPKKKKNISAEIQLDSRGLREQFDSGQMMGNYTTKIDERAKEIEEMRKMKAGGMQDTWESQPVTLEGVTRASEQVSDDFLLAAGKSEKAFNSRIIRNEFNRKARGMDGPKVRKGPRAITPPREGEKVYENEPVVLEGVVRANDPKEDPVLVNRGGARSLRDKFNTIIHEENTPKRRGPRAITPPGGVEDVYENEPDALPEGCVRSSDRHPSADVNFQKGRIGSMREGFMQAAEEAKKSKRSRSQIEIVRDGVQEVYESNPEESHCDAKSTDQSEQLQTRGLARNMKDRFMQDVEDRRRNVKKTQIIIDHTIQDTFENNPDESFADYKASDKFDSIPTRGLAKTMTQKFFQDVEQRGKVRKTQIVIDRDGNPEVYENDPEGHFADSTWEATDELIPTRGFTGNMKSKFLEDAEERKRNIQKTAIDIPEFHGTQSRFDTAIGQKQRAARTMEMYGLGSVPGEDIYENEPEESQADVRSSITREERRSSRGGYAKQMQQQFLEDAEAKQKNYRRTEIDIPREGAIQDVFENNPEESGADVRAGEERHEVIQTKGLAKSMAMRAQMAADEANKTKTSSQRLPAPKKFVEYENVGVKAKSRQEYCGICQEPVYRNDRLDMGKFILHEACFRCLKCGLKLSTSNFATYGDALLCKSHYHQLFQMKGDYSELARTGRYNISGSTERLIQAGEITEEEAKQMLVIQAEVDNMVAERRASKSDEADDDVGEDKYDDFAYASYAEDDYYRDQAESQGDDTYSYSYSYGGSYGYQQGYDDEEEEEAAETQKYRRGDKNDDDDDYQNKLD